MPGDTYIRLATLWYLTKVVHDYLCQLASLDQRLVITLQQYWLHPERHLNQILFIIEIV